MAPLSNNILNYPACTPIRLDPSWANIRAGARRCRSDRVPLSLRPNLFYSFRQKSVQSELLSPLCCVANGCVGHVPIVPTIGIPIPYELAPVRHLQSIPMRWQRRANSSRLVGRASPVDNRGTFPRCSLECYYLCRSPILLQKKKIIIKPSNDSQTKKQVQAYRQSRTRDACLFQVEVSTSRSTGIRGLQGIGI